MAFLPLWTLFLQHLKNPKQTSRGNNARIERYFQGEKGDIEENERTLGKIGCIKAGRYLTYQQQKVTKNAEGNLT